MVTMKTKALFVGAMMCALAMVGCEPNSNDPVDPPATSVGAVTNLMANSKDYQTVRLKWNASSSATAADFGGYTVTVTGGAAAVQPVSVAKGITTAEITGLTEGTRYTFTVKAKNTAGAESSAQQIEWSPATRYTGIKLYETLSSNGSGLDLQTSANNFEVIKVADRLRWDLGLDTRDNENSIGSPKLLSYFGVADTAALRTTLVSEAYEGQTSLDAFYDTQIYNMTNAQRRIVFANTSGSFIIGVRTADGNFAKVLVKSVGGSIFQGTGTNRYVELDISYQSATGIPYALTAGSTAPTGKILSSSTTKKVVTE